MTVAQRMQAEPASHRTFFYACGLLFLASAAETVARCASMSATAGMPMPGGWTMSMAWMRMPGQTWLGTVASFLTTWVVMMIAMMLPALVPMLARYRRAVGGGDEARVNRLSLLVGAGYFVVWAALGIAVFPIGVALAAVAMEVPQFARAVPMAIGVVVLLAGALQFTEWKARHLVCCLATPGRAHSLPADARAAWRYGLHLALHCSRCSCGLMAILLVTGVMDLRVMTVVAAAIAIERFEWTAERFARANGVVAAVTGLVLIVRTAGSGY